MKPDYTWHTPKNEMPFLLPAIVQSAFAFKNGMRIIVYTSGNEIKSFKCDKNWIPDYDSFAYAHTEDALAYHLYLRNELHEKESFVPEMSTELPSPPINQ